MRDFNLSGKKPIQEGQKPRTRKAKLDRIRRKVTEHKKVPEQIGSAEELFKKTFLSLDSAAFILDDKIPPKITDCNPAATKFFGYDREEFLGKTTQFLHINKKTLKEFQNVLYPAIKKQGFLSFYEYSMKRKNGVVFPTEHSVFPLKNERNKRIGWISLVRDISARKEVEKQLKQSKEFLANTINALEDTFFVKDEEHRWTVLNDAACEAIGRPRKELIGKTDYDVVPKEQADVFWEKDNLVLDTGETNVSEETVTWRGKLHTISTKKSLFKDFITGKRFIVGIARDITVRKQMEKTLRESEQKYRALVEQSMHGIVILQNYRIVFANKAACEIPGLTMEELLALSFEDMMAFIPPENRSTIRERLKDRFAGRDVPQNYELRLMRKNGKEFWLNLFFSTIEYKGCPAIQLAFIDITERKHAEEALRRSEKRFREIFENTAVGIYRTTPDGQILMANPALVHMLGYSSFEKLSQRNLEEDGFEPQYHRSMFKEEIKQKGRIVSWKSIWTTRDGKILNVIENARAVQDEDGTILYYEGTAENITERKVAEEALIESEEKFRNLAEQSPNMIFINKKGRVAYANKKCEEVMGYKREEFYHPNFDFMTLIAPEFKQLIKTNLSIHMKGEEIKPYEYGLITKGGERLDAIITTKLIKYDGEDSILGTITDITEHKKAQEEIAKLAKFPAEDPNPVLRISKDSTILYANNASSIVLDTWDRRVNERLPEACRERVEEVFSSGTASTFEFHCNNGQIIEVKLAPIVESGYANAYGLDITERKKAEEALQYRLEFEKLITTISTEFVNLRPGEIDKGINGALKALGEFVGVDRSYVFLYKDNTTKMDNTHEWCRDGIEPYIQRLQDLCIDDFYTTREILKKSEVLQIPCLDDLPPEALPDRQEFESEGIQSLICVPLICGESHVGFMGFDSVRTKKTWSQDEVALFKVIGEMLANALERKQAEEALRNSEERLRLAVQTAQLSTWDWNLLTDEVWLGGHSNKILGLAPDVKSVPVSFVNELFHPEDLKHIRQAIEQAIKERTLYNEKFRIMRPDGTERWIAAQGQPMYDKTGKAVRLIGVNQDITERKQAEVKLHEHQKQLKSLASQLTLAEERERRRIATELHDEISQSLFISKMKVEALHKSASDKKTEDTLDEISNSLGQIIGSMRSLTFDLSSPILYEFGFEEAVAEWLNERVEKKYGIATELEDDGLPKQMDDDIRVLLFRNVRELLINVVKHSQAKNIKVSTQKVGSRIRVSVEDDGVGFEPTKAESMITSKKAFGLFSIRERLEHLGGNLDIKSAPGCGCRITITSPLKREVINKDKQK